MMKMLLIVKFIFLIALALTINGTVVQPKGTVQYVFNVPTEFQGGTPADLQTAISNLQEQVTVLSKRLRYLESNGTDKVDILSSGTSFSGSGTNYIRWGRKTCPAQASLIYAGYAAKSYSGHTGGGIDYMCLPQQPNFSKSAVPNHQGNTYTYGVEMWAKGIDDVFQSSNNHNDMSCAVCEVPRKQQTLMIPGKTSCPANWHLEYEGYVMAAFYVDASPSNYICVDKDPVFAVRGTGAQDSGYAIPVEVVCGTIPCPPYKQGLELSCVLCSK